MMQKFRGKIKNIYFFKDNGLIARFQNFRRQIEDDLTA
jgi:hypothetical protein